MAACPSSLAIATFAAVAQRHRYQRNTIIDERAPTGIPAEIFARHEVRHLGQEGSMLKERGGASLFLFYEANETHSISTAFQSFKSRSRT
jgi:hypothetical protein